MENTKASQIDLWIQLLRERLQEVGRLAKGKKVPSFFSIGSTRKKTAAMGPYLTPIRDLEYGVLSGVIVFDQTQAILAASLADGVMDHILVDAEKRLEIQVDPDLSALDRYSIPRPSHSKRKTVDTIELGNLSAASAAYIVKSKLIEYKPNDLTAEAVWHFASHRFNCLSGHRVGMIGCGNIGFKLALKLVEAGCNVGIHRRDSSKGQLMADAINQIKHATTLATAQYHSDPIHASLFANFLVGASPGIPVITKKMVQSMAPDGFVIDVGKGCIAEEAVAYCADRGIEVFRCDITSSLYGFVSAHQKNGTLISEVMGRREIIPGTFLISGGYLGKRGDIVVDNYKKPRHVHGIADGNGDFMNQPSPAIASQLAHVKEIIENEKKGQSQ